MLGEDVNEFVVNILGIKERHVLADDESAADIARRLARADNALPAGLDRVVTIDNSGALGDTVAAVLAAFRAREEVTE